MNLTPDTLMNAFLGALGGGSVAFWLLRRAVERVDRLETRIASLDKEAVTRDMLDKFREWQSGQFDSIRQELVSLAKDLEYLKGQGAQGAK